MSRKRTFYAREPMERLIAERVTPGEEGDRGVSPIINRTADRYLEVVRRSEPPRCFSESEWLLLQEVLGDAVMQPAGMLQAYVPQAVADAVNLDDAHVPFEVDGAALVETLRGMSYAQVVALVDRIERQAVSDEKEKGHG